MSCTVTVDGACRRTLTFSIERERLQKAIDEGLVQVSLSAHLKGFRPGKAPPGLIRKTYGKRVEEDARRKLMGEEFAAAVEEHSLEPVGDPEMNLEKLDDGGEGPITFEFAIEVVPEVELQIPDEIPVTVVLPPVDETMVDGEVQRFREQAASLEDAPEGGKIARDDILEGTVEYEIDGSRLEPRTGRAAFTKHDLVDSVHVEGSGSTFEDHAVGDCVEFQAQLPPHFAPAEHGGKDAIIRFTIEKHRLVIIPDLDEKLLATADVKSEEELRDRIRQELEMQRTRVREQQVDRAIEGRIEEDHDFELPVKLAEKNIERRVHEYAHELMKRQGLESEEGHHQAEEKREEIAKGTRFGIKLAFLLTRIARENKLEPTKEATVEQVRTMARQQGTDPDALLKAALEEGWLGDVHEQLSHQNARAWLRQRAQVTETAPETPDEAPPSGTLEAEAGA